jgi:hypothetical protein
MQLFLVCAVAALAVTGTAQAAGSGDGARIAALVDEMGNMDYATLEALPPVDVKSHQLPGPSVDVMRVRLEETYSIQGIGEDTVELNGWIAVRHGASRPAPGYSTVSWETAVTDTEFVGLELQGESKVFGPVRVSLDTSRPAIGQVGRIDVPEAALRVLRASNRLAATEEPRDEAAGSCSSGDSQACCRAPVNVNVAMPTLGLQMSTKTPAVWYSRVSTIPPVGHIASVTVEPVPMVSADREVGTLVSGTVKFREVVRSVGLSPNHQIQVADTAGAPAQ